MGNSKKHPRYLDRTEAERLGELKEERVKVNRSAKVVKGGRRFAFSALTVVGNQDGVVVTTGVVQGLVEGSGYEFIDRGEFELKGIGRRRLVKLK